MQTSKHHSITMFTVELCPAQYHRICIGNWVVRNSEQGFNLQCEDQIVFKDCRNSERCFRLQSENHNLPGALKESELFQFAAQQDSFQGRSKNGSFSVCSQKNAINVSKRPRNSRTRHLPALLLEGSQCHLAPQASTPRGLSGLDDCPCSHSNSPALGNCS